MDPATLILANYKLTNKEASDCMYLVYRYLELVNPHNEFDTSRFEKIKEDKDFPHCVPDAPILENRLLKDSVIHMPRFMKICETSKLAGKHRSHVNVFLDRYKHHLQKIAISFYFLNAEELKGIIKSFWKSSNKHIVKHCYEYISVPFLIFHTDLNFYHSLINDIFPDITSPLSASMAKSFMRLGVHYYEWMQDALSEFPPHIQRLKLNPIGSFVILLYEKAKLHMFADDVNQILQDDRVVKLKDDFQYIDLSKVLLVYDSDNEKGAYDDAYKRMYTKSSNLSELILHIVYSLIPVFKQFANIDSSSFRFAAPELLYDRYFYNLQLIEQIKKKNRATIVDYIKMKKFIDHYIFYAFLKQLQGMMDVPLIYFITDKDCYLGIPDFDNR